MNDWVEDALFSVLFHSKNQKEVNDKNLRVLFNLLAIKYKISNASSVLTDKEVLIILEAKICAAASQ